MPVQHLSDDDLLASFSGEPAAPSVKGMSDDAVLSNFAGAAFTDYAPVKSEAKTKAQSFVPGMKQGMIDVAGNIPIDAVQDYTKSQTAQFDKDYAGDNLANVGRAAGNIMVTAPLMAAGGAGLGMAGRSLAIAAPRVAPAVDFLSGSSNFWKTANGTPLTTGEKLLGAASKFTAGAESGAAANVLATGTSDESIPQRALEGAEVGGPLALVPTAGKTVKNLLTGGGPNPDRVALAKKAVEEFGIPIRGPQITSSPVVKGADDLLKNLPFTRYGARAEDAATAFTKAVGKTFGADAEALTPKVMAENKARIGKMFDEVADNTSIKVDTVLPKLAKIESEARGLDDAVFNPIKRQLDHVTSTIAKAGKSEVPGSVYKDLTKTDSMLDKAIHGANQDVADLAANIKHALNDALMENAPKELKDLAKRANSEYRNYMAVRPIMAKAGVDAQVNPSTFAARLARLSPDIVEGGGGKLGDLARISNEFFSKEAAAKPHPGIGGAAQLAATAALSHFAGANPLVAATIAGTSLAAAPVASAAINSNVYRNMLLRSGRQSAPQNRLTQAISPMVNPAATITLNRLNDGSYGQ